MRQRRNKLVVRPIAELKRREVAKNVLKIAGFGAVAVSVVVAPGLAQIIDVLDPKSPREKRRIWRTIQYLEERRFIKVEKDSDGNEVVKLTKQGKQKFTEDALWDLTIDTPRRWDGKWRLVMFDFPKNYSQARHKFRKKLKNFGFVQYQKSVFLYPYDCREEIQYISKFFGVEKFVYYVVAVEIDNVRTYAKHFKLV